MKLKKTDTPQKKPEEEKKVEAPTLKPTPKTQKEGVEEQKEEVKLKPVKKETEQVLTNLCHRLA